MNDPTLTSKEAPSTLLTVLLVDDIQENLDLLEEVLRDQGYRTVSTRSSLEALEIAKREEIHVIVADAMMPKMDGLELCKNIKNNPAKASIPYIIYTGNYIDLEDEELARSIGVDRYVMKYEGTRSLLDALGDIVRRRYGIPSGLIVDPPASIDDQAFLLRHHELMSKKLEEKMVELKLYADTLEMKNRELVVSEKRYRTLFENASVAIFVIDRTQRRIIDVNRQALMILNCSPSDFPDTIDLPFLDTSGAPIDLFSLSQFVAHEGILKTRTGERSDVDIIAGPIDQPNDTRIMLFVRDITETKRIREHLLLTEKMSLMGRLASGIAHEIRNPLAGIQLNLQYLSMKMPADSPDHESLEAALEGTQRIQQVIDDTLGLARVSPPLLQEESINAVIMRTLRFLDLPIRQKRVTLDTVLEESLPPILMDSKQFQQVLLNILQNAIDASPVEESISIQTRLCHTETGRTVEVSIRDRGPGLAPEIAQRLFDGFRTTKEGGTGLGLMLSKFIIDRHRGSIALSNVPDGGTMVRIAFPTIHQERNLSNAEW